MYLELDFMDHSIKVFSKENRALQEYVKVSKSSKVFWNKLWRWNIVWFWLSISTESILRPSTRHTKWVYCMPQSKARQSFAYANRLRRLGTRLRNVIHGFWQPCAIEATGGWSGVTIGIDCFCWSLTNFLVFSEAAPDHCATRSCLRCRSARA